MTTTTAPLADLINTTNACAQVHIHTVIRPSGSVIYTGDSREDAIKAILGVDIDCDEASLVSSHAAGSYCRIETNHVECIALRIDTDAMFADLEPTFTLIYTAGGHRHLKPNLTASGIERVGRTVMHVADRGLRTVTNIAVRDAQGGDVTFDFACFRK